MITEVNITSDFYAAYIDVFEFSAISSWTESVLDIDACSGITLVL